MAFQFPAFLSLLAILVIPATVIEASHGREQYIEVYRELDYRGESVKITDSIPIFDHTQAYKCGVVLNDNIKSVCGAGTWIFYQHSEYQDTSEMVKLQSGDCVNLQVLPGDVSSLRFVGSKDDYEKPSFTIFSGLNYTGTNFTYFGDTNDTHQAHQSFIITGDCKWAVFEQRDFSGKSVCLAPAIDDYVQVQGVPDHEADVLGIPANSIWSLNKGCWGRIESESKFGTERLLLSDLTVAGISIAVVLGGMCIFLLLVCLCCRLRCCCWRRQYDV